MELTFLGTASCYPTPARGVSCIALRCLTDGAIWLFDCGECSQTQLMRSHLKASKVRKIFITHLHGDHVFGLPGLLCTISQQKTEENDLHGAVEIFGPKGLRNLLGTSLSLSGSALSFPYVVHEILDDSTAFEDEDEDEDDVVHDPDDVEVALRKCASAVMSCDIPLLPNEKSRTTFSFQSSSFVTLISPPAFPSTPSASSSSSDCYRVRAAPLRHRIFSLGFVVEEPNVAGRLDVALLKARGIRPGPLYGQIKSGKDVACPDGSLLKASDALGPERKGRKLIILGDTRDSSRLSEIGRGADVVVHEATLEEDLREQCLAHGHSTPAMAARFASTLNCQRLILTHFSQRYKEPEACSTEEDGRCCVEKLLSEATDALGENVGGVKVELAKDLKIFTVSSPA